MLRSVPEYALEFFAVKVIRISICVGKVRDESTMFAMRECAKPNSMPTEPAHRLSSFWFQVLQILLGFSNGLKLLHLV
jgi:hypothetical protein